MLVQVKGAIREEASWPMATTAPPNGKKKSHGCAVGCLAVTGLAVVYAFWVMKKHPGGWTLTFRYDGARRTYFSIVLDDQLRITRVSHLWGGLD
jgi:hypothetical protein